MIRRFLDSPALLYFCAGLNSAAAAILILWLWISVKARMIPSLTDRAAWLTWGMIAVNALCCLLQLLMANARVADASSSALETETRPPQKERPIIRQRTSQLLPSQRKKLGQIRHRNWGEEEEIHR